MQYYNKYILDYTRHYHVRGVVNKLCSKGTIYFYFYPNVPRGREIRKTLI